jgi:hypothetical protein
MIKINCVHFGKSFQCKHPDCKKFLGIFRAECKLVTEFTGVCGLQQIHHRPPPPVGQAPKKRYDYIVKVV